MKTKMLLPDAERLANEIRDRLAIHCQRIEIAGSVRRQKAEVGDIELVAVPYSGADMFGNPTSDHSLNAVDWSGFGVPIKGGNKYKQIALTQGVNLDLFIVTPPAQWGVVFLIRTGPAEYSHKFVTRRQQGGILPSNMQVANGAIWINEHMIETPEETDVYKLVGLPYEAPQNRKV